ncbi:MAG: hypothetical protein WD669_03885 [Pirellulales bacterium]
MAKLEYKLSDDEVRFDDGQIVRFDFPLTAMIRNGAIVITNVDRIGDMVIIGTASPPGTIYGVDFSGKLHWKVELEAPFGKIPFKISGNKIDFRNGKIARFEHPISDVLQIGNFLVVKTWPPRGIMYNQNIFGVQMSGNVVWQIEPQYPETEPNGTFGGLHRQGDYAVVSNVLGDALYLDPSDGKVIKRERLIR